MEPAHPFDVVRLLSQRRILFAGATGFVGKVALSMLLSRYGDSLDKIYVLVRKGSSASAERRFFDKIATSEPFSPLREAYGEEGALEFLRARCSIIEGDITDDHLGLSPEQVARMAGQVDAVINCAGLVSFNPSLEVGLKVNTLGVQNVVELCRKWNAPLVHVSTAFVAGNRSGLLFEDEEVAGYFPKKGELDGRDFSLPQELEDARKIVARLREEAEDKALTSTFRQRALERLREEGRDPADEKVLRLAVGRERKLWLSNALVQAGMDRAQHWGWPNTYTYTKSLGEQVLAAADGLSYAIVRPSIVESALRFPFPGWNEGFTTSAPLCYAAMKGHRGVPASTQAILDLIPVDLVAAALLAITARAMEVKERRVYHLASGDSNPFIASRSVELVGLYRRRYFRAKESGSRLLNEAKARLEPTILSRAAYERTSAPMIAQGAKLLRGMMDRLQPKWGAPRVSALMDLAKEKLAEIEEQSNSLSMLIDLFLPFVWQNRYVFRCDNIRSLYARMRPEDKAKIPWDPEAVNWREYFLEIHLPGLEKWVFPGLDEERERRGTVHAHRDLLELFEASVHNYRHRVAFRRMGEEREERFTYGEVDRYAGRVASFLARSGVGSGDSVMLLSENRPEWGICYFGILRAGGAAVPVDAELPLGEVVNIAQRSGAKACLLSEEAARRFSGLFGALAKAGLSTQVHSMAQAMAGDGAFADGIGPYHKSRSPDDLASIIFTSGTTGQPKGVMLTHRNFASLVSKISKAFELDKGDGLLSVLPLHHTFEFSAGFLLPFSRGCEITYIDELTADRMSEVFQTGRVTAMVGVPALWQLLHRKVTSEIASKPALIKELLGAMVKAHGEWRSRTELNLGKLFFWPLHQKFGGRLRFMVSGGSALTEEVQRAFFALGFQLSEGYGLTEAAPVLTVTELAGKPAFGSVGKALPGIEIRIESPDADGVGEVLARGPNIMAGYFEDAQGTQAVLQDGWLKTGDLGRLDSEGRLYLVGRKKDVIIDNNGKNVYPDELEELYRRHPDIQELSIVGLPDDGGGEKVACLCVLRLDGQPREEVRERVEEHFRKTSAELPFYRRVKVLRFWETELPKTSTRKVKRKQVAEELRRLEKAASSGENARRAAASEAEGWLASLLSEVMQKPVEAFRPEASLSGDLGADSLMLNELALALEQAGVDLSSPDELLRAETVADLQRLLARSGRKAMGRAKEKAAPKVPAAEAEIPVPEPLARAGRALLSMGQRLLYQGIFDVQIAGKNNIPPNCNFLVVANHSSHLDMGLIKVVLGDQGERLAALAARDYFFNTPLRRAYFGNFTNLIPMERKGSLRESLRMAGEALQQGYNLLLFPEGTRSLSGELGDFKPTLGYLALTYRVSILPLYLQGTHEALPKGKVLPQLLPLEVRIGPLLEWNALREETQKMARSESYRRVTQIAEQSVRALRDGSAAPASDRGPHPEKESLKSSSGGTE